MKVKDLFENEPLIRHHYPDYVVDYFTNPDGLTIVKFADKDNFMKYLLFMLKAGRYVTTEFAIKNCRKAGYDYPELKQIEKSLNVSEAVKYMDYVIDDGDRIYFSDKEKFLKSLLKKLREPYDHTLSVQIRIDRARALGYDYPEFKSIEKSINSLKEEFEEDDLHRMKDYINVTNMSGTRRIKFADKEEFIKFLLRSLKHQSDPYGVRQCIRRSREAGYDYPEFDAILKSANSIKDR